MFVHLFYINLALICGLEMAITTILQPGLVEIDYYVLQERDYELNNLPVEFRMVTFPYGRCELLKSPQDLKISGHWLTFKEDALKPFSSLKILLMDPVNSPLVFPANFEMRGSPINVKLKNPNKGWYSFQIKVSQSHHLEDDPQFDCKEYSLNDTYGECIKQEWEGRFLRLLNCTPPMLDANQMCDRRFALNWTESTKVYELFYYWTFGTEWNNSRYIQNLGFTRLSANLHIFDTNDILISLLVTAECLKCHSKKWRSKERLDAPSICKCNVKVV